MIVFNHKDHTCMFRIATVSSGQMMADLVNTTLRREILTQ